MASPSLVFVQKAMDIFPSENRTQLLLKSYLLTRSKHVTNVASFSGQQQQRLDNSAVACAKCCTPWTEKQFDLRMIAKLPKKRTIGDQKSAKTKIKKDFMAGNSTKCAKKFHTVAKSVCSVCRTPRKSLIRYQRAISDAKLKMKLKKAALVRKKFVPIVVPEEPVTVKKKKKRKDPTAGLIIPPDMQKTDKPVTEKNKNINAQLTNHAQSSAIHAKIEHRSKVESLKKMPQQFSSIINNKKNKNKSNKTKTTKGVCNTQKTIANQKAFDAKQRNSLMALANMLKMKNSMSENRTTGLEALLRK